MSNLQLRIVSAVILAIVVLAITWYGGLAFRILSAAITLAIFFEWSRMSRPNNGPTGAMALIPDLCIIAIACAIIAGMAASNLIGLTLMLCVAIATLSALRLRHQWETAGFAYAALSGISLAMLRGSDSAGFKAILFLFAVVWATDIFAYFVGRAVGGPKLAPSISPGKTQSGAIGGLVAAMIAAVAIGSGTGGSNLPVLAITAALLSVLSQAGDLFESWVKRRNGVKDSGWLIPGHGGVMDRVDGLVVAAFALYVVGWLLSTADTPARGLFGG